MKKLKATGWLLMLLLAYLPMIPFFLLLVVGLTLAQIADWASGWYGVCRWAVFRGLTSLGWDQSSNRGDISDLLLLRTPAERERVNYRRWLRTVNKVLDPVQVDPGVGLERATETFQRLAINRSNGESPVLPRGPMDNHIFPAIFGSIRSNLYIRRHAEAYSNAYWRQANKELGEDAD